MEQVSGSLNSDIDPGDFERLRVAYEKQGMNMSPGRYATPAARQIENRVFFLNKVAPLVVQTANKLGFANPDLPLAQMNIESAGGRTMPAKNNFAGIKAYSGGKAGPVVKTAEGHGSSLRVISDRFAAFDTPEEFVDKYFELLTNKYPGTVRAKTALDWTHALKVGQRGGYATASADDYAKGVMASLAEARKARQLT